MYLQCKSTDWLQFKYSIGTCCFLSLILVNLVSASPRPFLSSAPLHTPVIHSHIQPPWMRQPWPSFYSNSTGPPGQRKGLWLQRSWWEKDGHRMKQTRVLFLHYVCYFQPTVILFCFSKYPLSTWFIPMSLSLILWQLS